MAGEKVVRLTWLLMLKSCKVYASIIFAYPKESLSASLLEAELALLFLYVKKKTWKMIDESLHEANV